MGGGGGGCPLHENVSKLLWTHCTESTVFKAFLAPQNSLLDYLLGFIQYTTLYQPHRRSRFWCQSIDFACNKNIVTLHRFTS